MEVKNLLTFTNRKGLGSGLSETIFQKSVVGLPATGRRPRSPTHCLTLKSLRRPSVSGGLTLR